METNASVQTVKHKDSSKILTIVLFCAACAFLVAGVICLICGVSKLGAVFVAAAILAAAVGGIWLFILKVLTRWFDEKERSILEQEKILQDEVTAVSKKAEKEAKKVTCVKCGKKIDADSVFCKHCGKKQSSK